VERKPALWSAVWRGDHKNFSAGDDLQEIYEDKFKYEDTMRFDYYTLQFDISWYLLNMKTKVIPYLSGASVGPTLGYAAMSDYAVCTDTTQAMVPSAAYGFVPTAGSSWLLSRLKGQLGIYMAMTAETLKGSHAL
jgi:enoyl-CoA hydratase